MTSKINIDGELTEISMGIDEEEIEKNDENDFDTIDLRNVVKEVNEQV